MPTLIVEDVPGEVYERIQQLARAQNRTISAETVRLLQRGLQQEQARQAPAPRLPDPPFLSEEISPPVELPRPGRGVPVKAIPGLNRLPDPPLTQEGPA